MPSQTPIVEEGTPEAVFDKPWRERTQSFLSQIIIEADHIWYRP